MCLANWTDVSWFVRHKPSRALVVNGTAHLWFALEQIRGGDLKGGPQIQISDKWDGAEVVVVTGRAGYDIMDDRRLALWVYLWWVKGVMGQRANPGWA